jgi:hypothetical protein
MRIERKPGEPIRESTWAYLTRGEAEALLGALEYYLADDPPDPDRHYHVDDGDLLTIVVET